MADLETGASQFVIVEREQLARLRKIATTLYREERLNGDAMRDLAHVVTAVLDQALDMPEHTSDGAPDRHQERQAFADAARRLESALSAIATAEHDSHTRFELVECDTCRAKPGAPTLCSGCLTNRFSLARARRMTEIAAEALEKTP